MKPAPSYKNTPDDMNPVADPLWKWVVKRYADEIYEPKTLVDQWRKARSHFERICRLRDVKPYSHLASIASRIEKIARNL